MLNAHHGWRREIVAAVASAAVLGGASLMVAQETVQEPAPEMFSAYAINTRPAGGAKDAAQPVIIHVIIDRWSTEQERQALVQAYDEKGPDGLLSALRKTKRLGTLRASTSLGWDLHYAVQVPEGDGRRVIVGTERRVNYWQVSRDKEATDYPFTLVELRLDKDGKGEGRISIATKITRSGDGKRIEIEHDSLGPVRLQDVRKQE